MSQKIKIGIVGFGNIGRGAVKAVKQQPDMELVAVFSRRGVINIKELGTESVSYDKIEDFQNQIDVIILCGGSANDLPMQTPYVAKLFHTIDSFDTHAKIPQHFKMVDNAARQGNKVSIISAGWDPGLFSINRVMSEAVLINGITYTFWGKGISQGHSEAVRRVKGVKQAVQYTIPSTKVIEKIRSGQNPTFTKANAHKRVCYIVLENDADEKEVINEIKSMPHYFKDYDTNVISISEEEFESEHTKMPHGGFVIHSGVTNNKLNIIEYNLKLDSNPEFTSSVLVTYARAAYRLGLEGHKGAKTALDIGPGYLHPASQAHLRENYL